MCDLQSSKCVVVCISFGYGSDFPHSANYTPFRGTFRHGSFRILLSAFRILPTPVDVRPLFPVYVSEAARGTYYYACPSKLESSRTAIILPSSYIADNTDYGLLHSENYTFASSLLHFHHFHNVSHCHIIEIFPHS